jgi:hypothetical protein
LKYLTLNPSTFAFLNPKGKKKKKKKRKKKKEKKKEIPSYLEKAVRGPKVYKRKI